MKILMEVLICGMFRRT